MTQNGLDLYSQWLRSSLDASNDHEKGLAKENIKNSLVNSPAYQSNAMVNGEYQAIVAIRKEMQKCSVTVIPGTTLCIGDLITVFGENWLCIKLYKDEYDVFNGELWLCNQIFTYQTKDGVLVKKYAILDNGSYTSGNDKAITIAENSYNCYMALDDESNELYIDKRLAVSVVYNAKGEKILEVGKIKWLDFKSKNFGEGSHLLYFGIGADAYNPDTDNVETMICDYKETTEENVVVNTEYKIDGKETIRNGSSRTYTITSSHPNEDFKSFEWVIDKELADTTLTSAGETCRLTLQEEDNLIGTILLLSCKNTSGEIVATKTVEVI
ncbi:MAG: hypothetical protein ACI4M6_05560 [Christensenellaceae bacterium]